MALGLLLVTLLAAAVFIDDDIEASRAVASHRFPLSDLVDQALMHDLQAAGALRDVLLPTERYRVAESLARSRAHLAEASEALQAFEAIAVHERARHLFTVATERRLKFIGQIDALAEFLAGRENHEAGGLPPAALLESLYTARDDYRRVVEELKAFQSWRVMDGVTASIKSGTRARSMLLMSWFVAAVVLIALGVYWRRQVLRELALRDQEIARLEAHKTTLVREVHHRIKNHLQGILGLIEKNRLERPETASGLASLHGHVLALVAAHGLQAKSHNEDVRLQELVGRQVGMLMASLPGFDVQFASHDDGEAFHVPAVQAVPLSLVVSELLINAFKHGSGPITVGFSVTADGAAVTVCNPVDSPVSLDLDAPEDVGTGLELAQSMLFGIGRLEAKVAGSLVVMSVSLPGQAHRHASNESPRVLS